MHPIRRFIFVFILWPLSFLILILGIIFSGIFILYQTGVLESWVKHHFKDRLSYSYSHTSWHDWDPDINLKNLNLISPTTHQSILKIQQINLQINLLKSLWHWDLVTDQLQISGMEAHFFKTSDGHWSSVRLSSSKSWTPRDFLIWLLRQKDLSINQVNLYFPGVTYSELNLSWTALSQNYKNNLKPPILGHVLDFKFNFINPLAPEKPPNTFNLNIIWTRQDLLTSQAAWLDHLSTVWAHLKSLSPYYHLIAHSDFNFNLALHGEDLSSLFVPLMSENFPVVSQLNSLGGDFVLSGDLSQGVLKNLNLKSSLQHLVSNNQSHSQDLLTIKNIVFETQYSSSNSASNLNLSSAKISLLDLNLGPSELFSKAWPSMNLQAEFNWNLANISDLAPMLSIQDLSAQIHTDHFDFTSQGSVQNIPLVKQDFLNHRGGVFFNLSGNLSGQNLEQVLPSYLPNHGLSPKLKLWLLNNIIKAPQVSSELKLLGLLKDFPFEHSNNPDAQDHSQFLIKTNIKNGQIIPWEHWPFIKNMQGSFTFSNQAFSAEVLSGESLGVLINHADISIPNIMPHVPSEFLINLNLKAQDNLARDYLSKTPISEQTTILNFLSLKNTYQIKSQLDFPLDQPEAPNHYQAQILFFNNILGLESLPNFPDPIKNLSGEIDINNQLISAKNLSGLFMDEPLSAKISSTALKKNNDADTKILIHGTVNAGKLNSISSVLSKLSGLVPFDLYVYIHPDLVNLEINSNLKGLISLWPSPFNKKSQESWPLFIHIQKTEDLNPAQNPGQNKNLLAAPVTHLLINSALSNQSQQDLAIFTLQAVQEKPLSSWQVSSGYFQIGTLPPIQTTVSSLNTGSSIKLNSSPSNSQEGSLPILPIKLHINFDNFYLLGSLGSPDFKNQADLNAVPNAVPNLWQIHVEKLRTPELFNQTVPSDQPAVVKNTANLEGQHEDKAEDKPENFLKSFDLNQLKSLPNVDLHIQDWQEGVGKDSRDLGALQTLFIKNPQGFEFKNIQWTNPNIKINGEISWLNHLFLIQGHSDGSNYGNVLALLGLENFLSQTSGTVDFKLTWQGEKNLSGVDLVSPDIRTLNGQVKFDLKNGMLSNVDPGMSRFLGLFSLDSLSQRLAFNFNDMTHKGLAFNTLSGQYDLSQGIAETQKVELSGPALDLLLKGSVDLPNKTMDQTVLVSPHLDSSIAIVAGILGGPVVGLVTWLADHVLSDTLFKNTGLLYHLYGPWDHPEFKIIENQKTDQKTDQNNKK